MLQEIQVTPLDGARLYALVGAARSADFETAAARARATLGGRAVVNVNSTASGGGVAELLQTLLAYARGAGVDTRWLVIDGDPNFFTITKRIHNHLYGTPGDGYPLDETARTHYESILAPNAAALSEAIAPDDVVLLHDPQTAALVPHLRRAGTKVVWRCHVGSDTSNDFTDRAWSFLRPYLEFADAFVFTRADFAPDWMDRDRLHVITPSIDPFSAKNAEFDADTARAILTHVGLFEDSGGTGSFEFAYTGGRPGRVSGCIDTLGTGRPPADRPLVTQLSRWDTQKDMIGVLRAFAR
ncbi:MAG: glycosyl transferase family 1, partial [Acidimicrobiia bacterium]|nr:glycosyl transferase family 1 [Acidimicrobiia bacterium]